MIGWSAALEYKSPVRRVDALSRLPIGGGNFAVVETKGIVPDAVPAVKGLAKEVFAATIRRPEHDCRLGARRTKSMGEVGMSRSGLKILLVARDRLGLVNECERDVATIELHIPIELACLH